jgi:hypothetical protein
MNEMIINWNEIYANGIEINDDTILYILLSADDQLLLSDSGEHYILCTMPQNSLQ